MSKMMAALGREDSKVHRIIRQEMARQRDTINLIASENYASPAVIEAMGTVLTNKYSEGYPYKRYYGGCDQMDAVESLAQERAKQLFGCNHANVQPHSGSQANMAVYIGLLQPGDAVLALDFTAGGHLTHGHKVNFSGRYYRFHTYHVDPDTQLINMDAVARIAREVRPKMIVAGSSSYPRTWDFAAFRRMADEVGALLMVDMAHFAGLVAGGAHADPFPYAHVVTTSTHKTLRGPRGGMLFCRPPYAPEVDKALFPGIQGGPLMHVIAAKAVMLKEALAPSFKRYAAQVVKNAAALAKALQQQGCRVVSGGTDNHMLLLDFRGTSMTGKDASEALERAGIVVNKNRLPYDPLGPTVTSGVRIGTAAVTTRGMKERDMRMMAEWITGVLQHAQEPAYSASILKKVKALTRAFPLPY